MVYLLNSPYSDNQPDSWLCGGVLISSTHVLTAAACLTDVTHIYVIAGYLKYVNVKNIENDKCTRSRKQKIVKIVIPKAYSRSIWIKFDIGIGIVEKPYNFSDLSYRTDCSYEPASILVNYDIKAETINSPVTAFGWGGSEARQPGLMSDINSEYLMEARTVITNITVCQQHFSKKVDFYFLCTYGSPEKIRKVQPLNFIKTPMKCDKGQYTAETSRTCIAQGELFSRRNENDTDPLSNGIKEQSTKINESFSGGNETFTRRQDLNGEDHSAGICQNDHGGPLVLVTGGREVVIGVALNSVYNQNYQCQGPFLYLSTAKSSVLIKCLLSAASETRTLCESLNYDIKELNVTWPIEATKGPGTVTEKYYGVHGYRKEHPRTLVRIRPQIHLSLIAEGRRR